MDSNFDFYVGERHEVLTWATANMLIAHANPPYLDALTLIESLKQEIKDQQMALAVTEKLLDRMAMRSQSNACENPSTSVHTANFSSSREIPPLLQKEAYPDVRFWTRAAYNNWLAVNKGITDGLSQTQSKRGRPSKTLQANKNLHHRYIEDANGTPVDSTRLFEISRKARRLWITLDEQGIAPTSSTGMSTVAYDFYAKEMLNDFLEFRLAAGMWKLDFWTSKNYSSWYQGRHGNKRKRNDTVSSSSGSSSVVSGSAPSAANNSASNTGNTPDGFDAPDTNNNFASNTDGFNALDTSPASNTNRSAPNSASGTAPDGNTNHSTPNSASGTAPNGNTNIPNTNTNTNTNSSAPNSAAPDGNTNISNTNPAGNTNGSAPNSASGTAPNGNTNCSAPNSASNSALGIAPNGNTNSSAPNSAAPYDNTNTPNTNLAGDNNSSAPNSASNSTSGTAPDGTTETSTLLRIRLRRNNPCNDINLLNRMDKQASTREQRQSSDGNNDGQHNDNNGEEENEERREEDADTQRPSKRAKVLAVAGTRNTAKNMAKREWIQNHPGGLEHEFEAYYKKLTPDAIQAFDNAAKVASKAKTKARQKRVANSD
ncbi:hypothetical protein JOM56_015729 [Amanita muscaria]